MNPFGYIKQNGIIHAIDIIYQYKLDKFLQIMMTPFYSKKPVKNIIMIESHNDFDCNGGAFYNYLIEHKFNNKYKIVWLLKHPESTPDKLPSNVECYPLYRPSIKKNYYIWSAKYFLADNTVTSTKKKEQISIYLTHGVGSLKSVRGKMHMDDTLNYILTASKNYAPIMARQVGEKYPSSRMISIGFPVHDLMYKKDWHEIDKITSEKYSKILLWMPTFRKGGGYKRVDSLLEMELGIPLLHSTNEYNKLNEYLSKRNALLVIKIHPMQDMDSVKINDLSNIKVLTGKTVKEKQIDNYRLVTDVDALISDYSSIATEYLHIDRPISYVFEDENQFTSGFCVDNVEDLLAGPKLMSKADLYKFIDDVIDDIDDYAEKRKKMREWMFDFIDDQSCRRLAEFMEL